MCHHQLLNFFTKWAPGFVTYSTPEMVDAVQENRPHKIDGTKVETKRATPREESGKGESGQSVKKVFIGGLKDGIEDKDLEDYFGAFGRVINVEQVTRISFFRFYRKVI